MTEQRTNPWKVGDLVRVISYKPVRRVKRVHGTSVTIDEPVDGFVTWNMDDIVKVKPHRAILNSDQERGRRSCHCKLEQQPAKGILPSLDR